jgi:hypothetical protein
VLNFQRPLSERLERSKAVERLERLERAATKLEPAFLFQKAALKLQEDAFYAILAR